jgi:hypothetical protein
MTANTTENSTENIPVQAKPEESVQKPQTDASPAQKSADAKPPEEDPNWRAFREARKQDRAKTEAAEKKAAEKEAEAAALKAAMEAAFSKENQSSRHRADLENREYASDEETEDERIENKVKAILAAREAAQDRARAEREQQEYPQRLTQTYSDFDQIVSSENLDYLEYHYPEVANPLRRLGDGYDKWADIYKAVKKFVPNAANAKKDAARAEANFNKPKSMSISSVSPTGEGAPGSARLSAEKKAENWARMEKARKGIS